MYKYEICVLTANIRTINVFFNNVELKYINEVEVFKWWKCTLRSAQFLMHSHKKEEKNKNWKSGLFIAQTMDRISALKQERTREEAKQKNC